MRTLYELPVEAVIMSSLCNIRSFYKDGERVCHSNDGITPAPVSTEPQAKKCAVCFQNQWGSQITPNGKRGKGCTAYSRLTMRQLSDPNDALSLRVPASSLKSFRDYEKEVTSRGEALHRVVTKVDTIHEEHRSLLAFRVMRFLSDDELDTLTQASKRVALSFPVSDGFTY